MSKNDLTMGAHLPPIRKKTREAAGEKALCAAVEASGGLFIKLGNMKGIPDRLTVVGGRVCFIEMKRPKGGEVSPSQEHVMAKLKKAGANVGCFSVAADAIAFALGNELK